jgi:hypothetical protein
MGGAEPMRCKKIRELPVLAGEGESAKTIGKVAIECVLQDGHEGPCDEHPGQDKFQKEKAA